MTSSDYCLLGIDWWPFCMSKAEWSGWVQAVGSVAAILGAWFGIRHQLKREETRAANARHAAILDMTQAVYLTTFDAWQTLRYIADRFTDNVGGHISLLPDRVHDLQDTFRAFAQKDLTPQLLVEALRVQRELAYTIIALKQSERSGYVSELRAKKASRRANIVKDIADRLEAELRAKGDLWRDSTLLVDAQDLSEMSTA